MLHAVCCVPCACYHVLGHVQVKGHDKEEDAIVEPLASDVEARAHAAELEADVGRLDTWELNVQVGAKFWELPVLCNATPSNVV